MSIKFIGSRGENRIRLIPKNDEARMIVDRKVNGGEGVTGPGIPIKLYDGSYSICLSVVGIQCDGAWSALGMLEGIDYQTGWTVFINDNSYGHFDTNNRLEDNGAGSFDYLMYFEWYDGYLQMKAYPNVGPLRIKLVPDMVLSSVKDTTFIDVDSNTGETRPSEMVVVDTDGSISVCLQLENVQVEQPM